MRKSTLSALGAGQFLDARSRRHHDSENDEKEDDNVLCFALLDDRRARQLLRKYDFIIFISSIYINVNNNVQLNSNLIGDDLLLL
ncbi:hypothetical protein TNCV_1991561 [Trichonephila clavipes]|nr:hypothetical protein TNCV_1991561 [Trichonephila clavipes]